MGSLIYQHNGQHCTGKCDSNCYNATGPICDCICGGKNHGVGLEQAKENTRLYAEEMIEQYSKANGIDKRDLHVNPDIFQLSLFK